MTLSAGRNGLTCHCLGQFQAVHSCSPRLGLRDDLVANPYLGFIRAISKQLRMQCYRKWLNVSHLPAASDKLRLYFCHLATSTSVGGTVGRGGWTKPAGAGGGVKLAI